MRNWILLSSTICLALTFKLPNFFVSQASVQAFQKYLEETCQTVNDTDLFSRYRDWELHMFINSLRIELLPETESGNFSAFVKSPLSRIMPVSPLLDSLDPGRCSQQKKAKIKSVDHLVTSNAFQDYIIDLLFDNQNS